jgi:hypothetical protein
MTRAAARGIGPAGLVALEALAVFAFACAVRAPQLGQEASGDELFHVLAARQYLVDGTLAIHGGEPYDRVRSFTLAITLLFRVFGESLAVSRLPALVAGSALASLAFLFVRARGGAAARSAAWIAGGFVALDPELVRLSQMCRFYAPQHLLFLAGAAAAFFAADGALAPARRALAVGVAAACLWAAQEAQVVSRIGMGGIALYVALVSAAPLARWLRTRPLARVAAAVAALGGVALAAYGVRAGWHHEYLALARYVDLWAAGEAEDWRFYHRHLLDTWPTLWTLLPAATLVALVAAPRLALLSACVFGVALGLHSLMAFKSPRFFSYALPFFFLPWAIALARLVPALARAASAAWDRIPDGLVPRGVAGAAGVAGVAGGLAAALAVAFSIATNNGVVRTARLVVADPSFRDSITVEQFGTLSWTRASAALAPLVAAADAVVVTEDVKALYYLGRADFVINQDHLFEDLDLAGEPREEFSVDPKIDVPIVSRPDSIDRVARCHANGLVVAQTGFLKADWIVPADTRAHLLARLEPVPLPEAWGVTALRWTTPAPASGPECHLRRPWRPSPRE